MAERQYQAWVNENAKLFPDGQSTYLLKKFEGLNEDQFLLASNVKYLDPTIVTVVSVLLGWLGVDRFMLGDIGYGVIKLFTLGGGFIWWIIDWFIVGKKAKEKNMTKINNSLLIA